MSANVAISNVHADHVDIKGGCAVGWQTRNARFHFWLSNSATEYTDQPLYKNSLADYKQPGYFDTRQLDGTKPVNAKIIAQVMSIVRRGDMINVAKRDYAIRLQAEINAYAAHTQRRARALEIFASMRMIMSGEALYFTLTRDDMEALLAYQRFISDATGRLEIVTA